MSSLSITSTSLRPVDPAFPRGLVRLLLVTDLLGKIERQEAPGSDAVEAYGQSAGVSQSSAGRLLRRRDLVPRGTSLRS
ncbi:MAG TPA: hypothetical protein VHL31_07005 [Geminicoccus sp.]|jgi:hypothetical protein|uniref:hypothetical protein n=1 Tax=Geminicoccus sp. TaxID=2024832 RepID=UPI002E35DF1F|nr:hypothetical protein [Geminicoccus sp.]HEX2526036.1 hypothetical protein [Geminicoccus sp.]